MDRRREVIDAAFGLYENPIDAISELLRGKLGSGKERKHPKESKAKLLAHTRIGLLGKSVYA